MTAELRGEIQRDRGTILDAFPVVDMHGCMPLRPGETTFLPQLERYRRAGCDAVFLNIGFGDLTLDEHVQMIAHFRHWLEASDDYRLLRCADDIEEARSAGKLAVGFDIEGMNALGEQLSMVSLYRDLGVGWMLIAYNQNNPAGGGCQDDDQGLTPFGRDVIAEMARVGMMLCCTHTGKRTALEAIDLSPNPVIFSHSNPRAVYDHPRNIDDEVVRACAARGGVVCVNGIGIFLGDNDTRPRTVARHIDHIVQTVGVSHVGIGLDYVFDSKELDDYIASKPNLFPPEKYSAGIRMVTPESLIDIAQELSSKGYTNDDIEAIFGGNVMRVMRTVM